MARLLLSFLALVTGAYAATLTATLKPATVNLGKSATLTLVCEGGIATTVEQTAAARNLVLSFVDSTKSIDIVGGDTRESTTFTYQVTPRVAGRFAVPAFKAMVGNREIRSDAIILTVLDADGNNTPKNIAKTPPPRCCAYTPPPPRCTPVRFSLFPWNCSPKAFDNPTYPCPNW